MHNPWELSKVLARREFLAGAASALLTSQLSGKDRLSLKNRAKTVTFENGRVKAKFTRTPQGVLQQYFAADGRRWVLVASGLLAPLPRPPGTAPLYSDRPGSDPYRVLAANTLDRFEVLEQSPARIALRLLGGHGGTQVEQIVSLEKDTNILRIEVRATLPDPKLEYLLSAFTFEPGHPDFTHAPCLKHEPDDVIPDRVFHSPAVILQKGHVFAALCPDLNSLGKDVVYAPGSRRALVNSEFRLKEDPATVSMPAIFDLDLQSGLSPLPVFAYGYAGYIVRPHVYWRHDNSQGPQQLSTNHLSYGMDLIISATSQADPGYQAVSRYLWHKYGAKRVREPKPQAMPFTEYAAVCYPAAFAYKGDSARDVGHYARARTYDASDTGPLSTWLEFGEKGGMRGTPQVWYNDIRFTGWWNNVHIAQGLYWWGQKDQNPQWTGRARRILNLALSAPQNEGIFPAVYRTSTNAWVGCYWNGGWNFDSDLYQTCAASRTAALLLRYRRKCQADPGILPFVRRYGDFLASRIDQQGCLPAWFTRMLEPAPQLRFNAEGGVHISVLSELYTATGEHKYLDAALRLSGFLEREILPQQRWADFETFYSCSAKPEDTFDARTGQWPRCTLSMLWAIDGLTALYEATRQQSILQLALAIADYAVLYQSIWQPHFIRSAYVFGGFTVQNTDAEWLDMRQCIFGEALVRLGITSGRQDLLERGAAALRASFATINHPLHVQNGIFQAPMYPLGLSPENIDHDGLPQACFRSGADWGECGALASAAEILSDYGSIYIDVRRQLGIGFDGVAIKNVQVESGNLVLEADNLLGKLPVPFQNRYSIEIVVEGLPAGKHELTLNGEKAVLLAGEAKLRFKATIPGQSGQGLS